MLDMQDMQDMQMQDMQMQDMQMQFHSCKKIKTNTCPVNANAAADATTKYKLYSSKHKALLAGMGESFGAMYKLWLIGQIGGFNVKLHNDPDMNQMMHDGVEVPLRQYAVFELGMSNSDIACAKTYMIKPEHRSEKLQALVRRMQGMGIL